MPDLRTLHGIAALVHAMQAVAILGLTSWLDTAVDADKPHGVFALTRPMTGVMIAGFLDVRYATLGFLCLAIMDHACVCIAPPYWEIEQLSRHLRYMEWSVSAPLMTFCVAAETGISDLYTHLTIWALMFASQIFGLLADILCNLNLSGSWNPTQTLFGDYMWYLPNFAAWATCVFAFSPILDTLAATRDSLPGYVTAIVVSQFVMFASAQFVQTYHLYATSRRVKPWFQTESVLVVVSLCTKTTLAWLMLVPLLSSAA